MRKKISLYIGERLVDLDTSSLILFNYTMEDLSNPTIVKNSYSQQVTLKGTANNNAIFGDYFRLDRRISLEGGEIGAGFNASRKTPFQIFAEDGSILESGYVKLDDVIRKKGEVEYKVTLYGGLGSFLYSLSYDENGNKRTLADLDYIGGGDGELTFNINKTQVQEAWNQLNVNEGESGYSPLWHTINFAPCYNGLPSGDFDPKKAIFIPSEYGLSDDIDSHTYELRGGRSLITFTESHDEWAVKDLRSYLQRPILSFDKVLDAICNPSNNGGYEVDMTNLDGFQYKGLWMTLPLIASLGSFKRTGDALSSSFTAYSATSNKRVGVYAITGGAENKVMADINLKLRALVSGTSATYLRQEDGARYYGNNIIQAIAYNSQNEVVGGSNVVITGITPNGMNGRDVARFFNYDSPWAGGVDYVLMDSATRNGIFNRKSTGVYEYSKDIKLSLEARDVAKIEIIVSPYMRDAKDKVVIASSSAKPFLWTSSGASLSVGAGTMYNEGIALTKESDTSLRSNATITKRMLLSSSKTPAEYLLSFCKMFGIYLLYDNATKKVTLLRRNDLFQDETIDLTKRIDKSKDITIHPMVFDAKWYEFSLSSVGGAFSNEYKETEGREYGVQRVNTGYDFNADVRQLLDNNAFKSACTTLDKGRFYNIITQGGKRYPSIFREAGNKYTLYNSSGSKDVEIPVPSSSATIQQYNNDHMGYDYKGANKLELRDKSNKGVNGEDVLVYFVKWQRYFGFKLTDDSAEMSMLNDGKPCWDMTAPSSTSMDVPIFGRYRFNDEIVRDSLDFGVPFQLDIPDIIYNEGVTIYDRLWKNYIADRYDANTKVMTCKVNLSGLQVGAGLLRKFFWYENTLWTLNKISNYSLTTLDAVECEFIQVINKSNYINGQSNG